MTIFKFILSTLFTRRRQLMLLGLLLLPLLLFAQDPAPESFSSGRTRYDLTAQALVDMVTQILLVMTYLLDILYAIASLLAIYNATVIYVKLQAGEDGFTKSAIMLVGSLLFLIAATTVLPGFFGYNYGAGGYHI